MKYMVMECHLSYAVVLDEDGRFLKVANRNYEVGQMVADVIEMQIPEPAMKQRNSHKWLYSITAVAACLMLMVTSVFQMGQMPYASVYMTINPEVRIDVNRKDIVVGLDGVNADGDDLVEGYQYKKKHLDMVMDELVDKAIDMGYLYNGGQITLALDTDHKEWIILHEDALTTHLQEHLNEKLSVTIEVTDKNAEYESISIPVAPEENNYDDTDYDEDIPIKRPSVQQKPAGSDYGSSGYDDVQMIDGDSGYDNEVSGYEHQADFDDDDYSNDSASNYGDSEYDD